MPFGNYVSVGSVILRYDGLHIVRPGIDLASLRAHTNAQDGRVDSLTAHLARVSELAREFASHFGASELGALLGLLHDVGKALPGFQEYLKAIETGERRERGPRHAIWGAALWYCLDQRNRWPEVCLPIAGHHGGLCAASDLWLDLAAFAEKNLGDLEELRATISSQRLLAKHRCPRNRLDGTRLELRIRLLLSALSDADFLATEEHFNPTNAETRGKWPDLADLWPGFEQKQKDLLCEAKKSWNSVQEIRAEVYRDCLKAAELPKGIFRLTVPTGGGKTRSGLAFALRHALHYNLRRVVLALPYTSITEQSANVYRDVLGEDAILEHHSNMEEPGDGEGQDLIAVRARLASENWESPVIVTTTVQLFESLFARRPGKVRKLHNLAGSVILLDEAQTLPFELLRPTLDTLRALVEDAGCTVVLCTATQPAFDDTPYLREFATMPVREIVPNSIVHFAALRRVRYERRSSPLTWAEIAAEIKQNAQVLVILNTRRDALSLLDALRGEEGLHHLSTLLCGAHRREVLKRIEEGLPAGRKVRAICTQVVEAGVDLDFPAVYRALGPLDRIVQAAGRCNRSGRLSEPGVVVIFQPVEGGMPKGAYRVGYDQAAMLLDREVSERLHDPALYHEYFQRVFSLVELDGRNIQDLRSALDYPEVAIR
ncbi:MAG: CRISPR-associated helicase Cas3', partial [Bryobacteraceae bacterium]